MNTRFDRIKSRLQALVPKRHNNFLERLTEQSASLVEGGEALVEYMHKPSNRNAQALREVEKNADEIRRILIDELNRTFVTPIDREDIFALSRALDDVLDYMYSVVNEMDILQVKPTGYLQEMADLLNEAAGE